MLGLQSKQSNWPIKINKFSTSSLSLSELNAKVRCETSSNNFTPFSPSKFLREDAG
jgi:hypothetical protein